MTRIAMVRRDDGEWVAGPATSGGRPLLLCALEQLSVFLAVAVRSSAQPLTTSVARAAVSLGKALVAWQAANVAVAVDAASAAQLEKLLAALYDGIAAQPSAACKRKLATAVVWLSLPSADVDEALSSKLHVRYGVCVPCGVAFVSRLCGGQQDRLSSVCTAPLFTTPTHVTLILEQALERASCSPWLLPLLLSALCRWVQHAPQLVDTSAFIAVCKAAVLQYVQLRDPPHVLCARRHALLHHRQVWRRRKASGVACSVWHLRWPPCCPQSRGLVSLPPPAVGCGVVVGGVWQLHQRRVRSACVVCACSVGGACV